MSTPHSPSRRGAAASALLALFASVPALSAQSVWTGVTGSWNTADNWSPAGVPVSGATTALEFGHSGALYTATNDIAGDFQLNVLRFSGSTAGNIQLAKSGSAQSLVFVANGSILPEIQFNSSSSAAKTINIGMVLDADTRVTSSIGNAAGNLQLGTLSGTGALVVDFITSGSGAVLLQNASTHSGGVRVQSGRVVAANNASFGVGDLTVSGGVLRATNGATSLSFANALRIAGNASFFEGANANGFTFTGGGSIEGTNATRTITLGNAGATLTLGGAFSGAGNGLTLAGNGTLALGSGETDTATNTFDGTTTVSASGATLRLNKAEDTNALAGNLAVSAGNVSWARSNQIADTASIAQSGGTVKLDVGLSETVANTTITGGTFTVSKDATYTTGAFATTAAGSGSRAIGGVLAVGSGGLNIAHDGNGATRNAFTLYDAANTSAGVLQLGGDLTFTNATASTSKVQITRSAGTGYIDLAGGNRTFTINDGAAAEDLEITVRITNGGLIKQGAGVLAFANTASDYTGDTVINQGAIRANSAAQTLATQSTYVLANASGATLDLNGNNQTIGGLSGGGATGGAVTLGAGTLTVGNNNASTSFAGAITGTGGLTKIGAGALTLSSDLGYTGATLVSGGTLVVDGQLASSGVTVNGADAVLRGSGRVKGLNIASGTLSGSLTSEGSVSFGATSVFSVSALSASSFDQLFVGGGSSSISIADGASLVLTGFESFAALDAGTEFILISNEGAGSIIGSFLGYDEGHTFTLGLNTFTTSYQLGVGGNHFGFVVASAIPEPSAFAALAGLASLALVTQRRRRRA
jgi:Uncharacterized protein with a C-terminal OMP (outer membrane protein) domain